MTITLPIHPDDVNTWYQGVEIVSTDVAREGTRTSDEGKNEMSMFFGEMTDIPFVPRQTSPSSPPLREHETFVPIHSPSHVVACTTILECIGIIAIMVVFGYWVSL